MNVLKGLCPDCDSDGVPHHESDGWHITIKHDDTCPVWRSMQ